MDRKEYISRLFHNLSDLSKEEIKEAINYTEEYFDEAGQENEQKVIKELGYPAKYAAQIRAESSIRENSKQGKEKTHTSSDMKSLWYIILGICALPIALPILIVALALVFVLIILVCTFIIVAICLSLAGLIAFLPLIISSFTMFTTDINSGMIALGGSLIILGLSILSALLAYTISIKLIPWCIKTSGKIFNKVKGVKNYEKAHKAVD